MEVILDCFFENFAQLERDNLHARYKRRSMVEYFNTLILGCSKGEECDPLKTCREAIIGILKFHQNSMKENGGVCLMGKYHNILYVAVKLCYDWEIDDSNIVVDILKHIYKCENTFERLWVGAIFGYGAPHYIAGWKSDFENPQENLRAVIYYLHHANLAWLEFQYEGLPNMRFIDVPIECCQRASPLEILMELGLAEVVHILLRFGAQDITSSLMIETLLTHFTPSENVYPNSRVCCLKYLLRTIPILKLERHKYRHSKSNVFVERFSHLVEASLVPANRCGLEPPDLKHLCRCVVRDQLWKNHMLPNGIQMLPVPGILFKYLDLLSD